MTYTETNTTNTIQASIEKLSLFADHSLRLQPVVPLGSLRDTGQEAVYILYYTGSFPYYQKIRSSVASNTFETPIFVGKIYGPRFMVRDEERTLQTCQESIAAASNLSIDDFYIRYFEVNNADVYEYFLIERYKPIWNCEVTGF